MIKHFGERTYHNLPRKDGKEGPVTFTSESALRSYCKEMGVMVGDLHG